VPKGAKNLEVAKDFLKFLSKPASINELLKVGLARRVPSMPQIVKDDPWWLDKSDPHRGRLCDAGAAVTDGSAIGGLQPTVGAGLRPGRGCGNQKGRSRLREGQRQQDRAQHHSVRAAAPEDRRGAAERRPSRRLRQPTN